MSYLETDESRCSNTSSFDMTYSFSAHSDKDVITPSSSLDPCADNAIQFDDLWRNLIGVTVPHCLSEDMEMQQDIPAWSDDRAAHHEGGITSAASPLFCARSAGFVMPMYDHAGSALLHAESSKHAIEYVPPPASDPAWPSSKPLDEGASDQEDRQELHCNTNSSIPRGDSMAEDLPLGYDLAQIPQTSKQESGASNNEHLEHSTSPSSHWKCPYPGCPETFRTKAKCTKHQRSHQDRRHRCSKCGKAFLYPKDLKRHRNTVHGGT